jgi:hypothetical protein
MLKGDHLLYGLDIVIGGVRIVQKVQFMYLFMSLGRILLQRSISRNLFYPLRPQVELRKVVVGIQLLANICAVADSILPGFHFAALFRLCPSCTICFLVYQSLLNDICSQDIGLDLRLVAGWPK